MIEIDTNPLYFWFRNIIHKRLFDDRIESYNLLLKLIPLIIYFSPIYAYSTVDLSDSVVFIGGHNTGRIVAKFDGNGWSRLPDLKQGRYWHGSIQINGKTFILGGKTDDNEE